MLRAWCVIVWVMCLTGVVKAQSSIELRSSAVMRGDSAVTLGDVAEVSGPDAVELAGVVIVENAAAEAAGARWFEVDVSAVRTALDAHKVSWGRTTLRGSKCVVSIKGSKDPAPVIKKEGKVAAPTGEIVDLSGPSTVKTVIASTMARLYNVSPSDLRLTFEAKDDELLRTSTQGRRVDVAPVNSNATSQVGLRVYVFAGDRLMTQTTITVYAMTRRTVVTAAGAIDRRSEIEASQLVKSEQWMAPSAAMPCTFEQAVGSIAKMRINAGQVVTQACVEPPIVVRKGDMVEVHCLAGGVHLKASRARAQGTARDGEMVELALEGSKKTFRARMNGRGAAVVLLDEGDGNSVETKH